MNPVVFLVSYPKSGNTWFRVFLENLVFAKDEPADINKLTLARIISSRELFDDVTGLESTNLAPHEIDNLRPGVIWQISTEAKNTMYFKVHDACLNTPDGSAFIHPDVPAKVLYFIRNPLDVVVSFAHHDACAFDETIRTLADDESMLFPPGPRCRSQLHQRILSWSNHVKSWLSAEQLERHLIRYEDMYHLPAKTFCGAVQFLGLEKTQAEIEKALEFSRFNILKKQEDKHGFNEKRVIAESFFRKGVAGSWRESLTEKQVARIIADHRDVMRQFGYLNDENQIVFG